MKRKGYVSLTGGWFIFVESGVRCGRKFYIPKINAFPRRSGVRGYRPVVLSIKQQLSGTLDIDIMDTLSAMFLIKGTSHFTEVTHYQIAN